MKRIQKTKYDRTDYHTFTTKDMSEVERRKINVGDIWMNTIKCKKCGDIITSNNLHDFKYCKCKSTFVDGGSWYGRYGSENLDDVELMTEMFDDVKGVNEGQLLDK